MLRKQLVLLAAVFCVMFFGTGVLADEICTPDDFEKMLITLSERLDTSDKNCEVLTTGEAIIKQDAARFAYEILVKADPEFVLSQEQAEEILNTCYDNAYIKSENKIAYASMIRHGVIGIRGRSNPDEVFTKSSAQTFINHINALFEKKFPITVGGKTISIGSSVNEVFTKFGDPDRIHKCDTGISWYVFNSNYLDFIIIGVRDDVVCSYFSNASSLEFTQNDSIIQIINQNGETDAVYFPAEHPEAKMQGDMLTDIINAHRAKKGLMTFVSKNARTVPTLSHDKAERVQTQINAPDFVEAYKKLLEAAENNEILCQTFGMASELTVRLTEDGTWDITAIDAKNTVVTLRRDLSPEEQRPEPDLAKVKAPQLLSPQNGEKTQGGDLTLQLKERGADKYLVKIYNLETESYDVFAYIQCKKDKIIIPSYILTDGNIYRACVTSVSEEEELPGNTVVFTHGNAEMPISILSPLKDLSTFDDELEISLYSSAYKDFRVDVYDAHNNAVATRELKGTSECVLESLPAGTYYVCTTAISHGDGKEKANAFTTVHIKEHTPKIREFILKPGEVFEYYYGDGKEWIYFYDTETIAEKGNEISPSGEEITVYKTKITQRIVPSTKKYRALAELIPHHKSITGAIVTHSTNASTTETGNAISAMAQSYCGVPYVWGGTTPDGFDCSGLVKYVCSSLGINYMARTAAEQFKANGVFVDKCDLIPGDLVFFQKNGTIHHVGIYIGDNMMVHAPHTGDVVKISSLEDSYYKREYAGAKRVS